MSQNQNPAHGQSSQPVVVLTGGGSGGHITPLLSLARELRRQSKSCKIVYIGLKGERTHSFKNEFRVFDRVYYISSGKFRRFYGQSLGARILDLRQWALNFFDLFKIASGTLSAFKILKKNKPQVVFSKGGFVVVPVGVAARLQKIPIVTHDSDAVPGLANRILGRWAALRTAGVPEQVPAAKRSLYVGIPVDPRIKSVSSVLQKEYRKAIGAGESDKVLVVSGGGLGARDLNRLITNSALKLLQSHPDLRIYHIAGNKHAEAVKHEYQKLLEPALRSRVEVIGFTTDFFRYTGAADLIISRAGATTIAELAVQGKPAVLVPAPFLTGGHQLHNADSLHKLGAVEVASNDMPPQKFQSLILQLLQDYRRRQRLAAKLSAVAKPDAATALAKLLLKNFQAKRSA